MDESDLSAVIIKTAGRPQSATSDNQSATAHSIDSLVKADQYLALKKRRRIGGIQLFQVVSGSAGPQAVWCE